MIREATEWFQGDPKCFRVLMKSFVPRNFKFAQRCSEFAPCISFVSLQALICLCGALKCVCIVLILFFTAKHLLQRAPNLLCRAYSFPLRAPKCLLGNSKLSRGAPKWLEEAPNYFRGFPFLLNVNPNSIRGAQILLPGAQLCQYVAQVCLLRA